jgi:plasmid stability protein
LAIEEIGGFAMTIELPAELEVALKVQASARGVSPDVYVREVLERDLETAVEAEPSSVPFKDGYGMLAKYGASPSAKEIDENRADMFRNFGEDLR